LKITVLVGLPGSGKTTYGESLGGCFVDDTSILGLKLVVLAIQEQNPNIVVSDVQLCKASTRELAKQWFEACAPGYEIKWVYFENDPIQCLANVELRKADGDDRKVEDLIQILSKEYTVGTDGEVRKVWRRNS
jgi:hypothetical protein